MKRAYNIAGHKFCLEMPEGDAAWDEMELYEPFRSEDEEGCVFTAELIDSMPDTSSKRMVMIGNQGIDMPRIDLYDWDGKWLLELAPLMEAPVRAYMIADKDFSKVKFRLLGSLRFTVNSVMMLMYAFSTACKETLLMHASVTIKDGKGYLFLGKSGTGKSTHSQLWIDNIGGCELLNDDNPILRVDADGCVRVYGSPWSGKTPCYRNINVPVGAIVDLHQAKKNVITKLSMPKAYAALYSSFSGYRFIKEMANGFHATIAKIISSVSCYSLDCLPDAEAAWLCYKTVTQ